MNSISKLPTVKLNDLQQLRLSYDEVELNLWSLVTLGVAAESFGTLVSTVVIDKLPLDIKLLIARHIKDTWNLTKTLELLNGELKAGETVNVGSKNVDSDEILSFTGSSLVFIIYGFIVLSFTGSSSGREV